MKDVQKKNGKRNSQPINQGLHRATHEEGAHDGVAVDRDDTAGGLQLRGKKKKKKKGKRNSQPINQGAHRATHGQGAHDRVAVDRDDTAGGPQLRGANGTVNQLARRRERMLLHALTIHIFFCDDVL